MCAFGVLGLSCEAPTAPKPEVQKRNKKFRKKKKVQKEKKEVQKEKKKGSEEKTRGSEKKVVQKKKWFRKKTVLFDECVLGKEKKGTTRNNQVCQLQVVTV